MAKFRCVRFLQNFFHFSTTSIRKKEKKNKKQSSANNKTTRPSKFPSHATFKQENNTNESVGISKESSDSSV